MFSFVNLSRKWFLKNVSRPVTKCLIIEIESVGGTSSANSQRRNRQFYYRQPLSSTKIHCRKFKRSTLNDDLTYQSGADMFQRLTDFTTVQSQPLLCPNLGTESTYIYDDSRCRIQGGRLIATLLNESVGLGIVTDE